MLAMSFFSIASKLAPTGCIWLEKIRRCPYCALRGGKPWFGLRSVATKPNNLCQGLLGFAALSANLPIACNTQENC